MIALGPQAKADGDRQALNRDRHKVGGQR
jgi:hypothetical protein